MLALKKETCWSKANRTERKQIKLVRRYFFQKMLTFAGFKRHERPIYGDNHRVKIACMCDTNNGGTSSPSSGHGGPPPCIWYHGTPVHASPHLERVLVWSKAAADDRNNTFSVYARAICSTQGYGRRRRTWCTHATGR